MTLESSLLARANSCCELCGASNALAVYPVPPESDGSAEQRYCIVRDEKIEGKKSSYGKK